jgi:hypothetical protein
MEEEPKDVECKTQSMERYSIPLNKVQILKRS